MGLANWALQTSPKFTTRVKYQFHQGFRPDQRSGNPSHPSLPNQNILIGHLSFENVEKFKYLGVTVTNTNDIREEIKRRINTGNACYYSLEKILSSRLLSKKLKVKTHKTIILPVALYGCETGSLTLREEHRLRLFENKVLRYLRLRETKLQENEES